MDGENGLSQVNPESAKGRRSLDYRTYLGLEKLLSCQVPSSMVPDERCFIITHQLFELVFRLMIFDLAVISETLEQLLALGEAEFRSLCFDSRNDFWQPALLSAQRTTHSSEVVLPNFIGYLAKPEAKDERFSTFSSREFDKFRSYLPPASGFQTAQFRLIQRAFGKSNLFSVRLFPGKEYGKHYEGSKDTGPVRIVDPIILRSDVEVAVPADESPLAGVGKMDATIHRVLDQLTRVSHYQGPAAHVPKIRKISQQDFDQALDGFRAMLSSHRHKQEIANVKPQDADEEDSAAEELFRGDFESAINRENDRRDSLARARDGAFYLHYNAPRGNLTRILSRLAWTDSALHGKQKNSFLSLHHKMVTQRIADLRKYAEDAGRAKPPDGTGGGGPDYLRHMKNDLIPLFPGLIAFLDLEDSPAFSWID